MRDHERFVEGLVVLAVVVGMTGCTMPELGSVNLFPNVSNGSGDPSVEPEPVEPNSSPASGGDDNGPESIELSLEQICRSNAEIEASVGDVLVFQNRGVESIGFSVEGYGLDTVLEPGAEVGLGLDHAVEDGLIDCDSGEGHNATLIVHK